jgi:hypothetical protein
MTTKTDSNGSVCAWFRAGNQLKKGVKKPRLKLEPRGFAKALQPTEKPKLDATYTR